MQPISKVHIDGCCYQTAGDAGLDFAEKLANFWVKVIIPTIYYMLQRIEKYFN